MKSKGVRSNLKIMAGLITLVGPMLPIIALAVVLGVLGFICACAVPILGAVGVVSLYTNELEGIGIIFALMIFAAILRGVLHYGEQASNHYIAFKLLAIIRSKVFAALRRLCPAKLEGSDKGNLISLITSDVELLEVFYAHTISPIAIAILSSAIFIAFIGNIYSLLGLIALAAYFTVGCILPIINSKAVKQAGLDYRNKSGELNSLFLDNLRGLNELLQYGECEKAKEKILAATDSLAQYQNKLKSREIITSSLTDVIIIVFNLLMLLTAFTLYMVGNINLNSAVMAVVTLMSTYGPVIALSNLSNSLAQTLASGERVLSLLDEKPQTKDKTDGKDLKIADVSCKNVVFGYTDKRILNGASLNIEAGKITGIYGKSGCGKSTLLKLIMRFWDKNSGEILLSGEEIASINTDCLRQNESYCTQETHLFNDTIGNNIRLARLDATAEEIEEAARQASIHGLISELPLKYDTPIGELGGRLSGGERQRIGLARAFLSKAPLMLLDEPTSNLDSLNEGIILKSLYEAKDKTIVLVSHRKSTLSIADKSYHIENGKAVN